MFWQNTITKQQTTVFDNDYSAEKCNGIVEQIRFGTRYFLLSRNHSKRWPGGCWSSSSQFDLMIWRTAFFFNGFLLFVFTQWSLGGKIAREWLNWKEPEQAVPHWAWNIQKPRYGCVPHACGPQSTYRPCVDETLKAHVLYCRVQLFICSFVSL